MQNCIEPVTDAPYVHGSASRKPLIVASRYCIQASLTEHLSAKAEELELCKHPKRSQATGKAQPIPSRMLKEQLCTTHNSLLPDLSRL